MAIYRALFVAVATLFTVGMTSGAFAGCGGSGWGWTGGNSWGCGGCGGCASYAPAPQPVPMIAEPVPVTTYAQPTAPAPIWVGGCGCGSRGLFYAPRYVVNQGPDFSGPGIMEPYRTYTPDDAYAPTTAYPYIGHRFHRSGFWQHTAYSGHMSDHPHDGMRAHHPAANWHLYKH